MAKQNYFNAQEIAEKLGISKQTLIRYEKRGVFPESRRKSGQTSGASIPKTDLGRLREILGRI